MLEIEIAQIGTSDNVQATYGCHTQKTVSTRFGTFTAFLTEKDAGVATWLLVRLDGNGAVPTLVMEGRTVGGPPSLDTDGDSLFLAVPAETYPDATFMRFDGPDARPLVTTVEGGGDGHHNLVYVPGSGHLLLAGAVYLFALDKSGRVLMRHQIYDYPPSGGSAEIAHYPLFALGGPIVVMANTTTPFPGWTGHDGCSNNCYPSFGLLLSRDGGYTFENPEDGKRPSFPIAAGRHGGAFHPLASQRTEFSPTRCMHNWLAGFLCKAGSVLMVLNSYDKSAPHCSEIEPLLPEVTVLSYELNRRTLTVHHAAPTLQAETLAADSTQFYLTSGARERDPLILMSAQAVKGGARLVALVSVDGGANWHDWAASRVYDGAYADSFYGLSSQRTWTRDRIVIGTFTLNIPGTDHFQVCAFRCEAPGGRRDDFS